MIRCQSEKLFIPLCRRSIWQIIVFAITSSMIKSFKRNTRHLESYQTALTGATPSFKVIRDMATVYKHLYPHDDCEILSGGSIERVTSGKQEIEYDYSTDSGSDQTGSIVIRRKGGSDVQFAHAIKDVIEMWYQIMEARAPHTGDDPSCAGQAEAQPDQS